MGPDIYALSPDDATVFHQMVAEWKKRNLGMPPAEVPEYKESGPWVAVVLAPSGGIPGMCDSVSPAYTGTGTRLNATCGTGTGTAIGEEGDRPGSADCDEYFLEHCTPGNPGRFLTKPRLRKTGRVLTVYNLSYVAVNGNQFVTAVRDAYGDWWVPSIGYLFQTCT